MILSKKVEKIEPSITLAITAKAKQMKAEGIDVIGFGAGEPDFNTPEYIQEAAIKAMKDGFTKYTPASGILELKRAIAKKFEKDNKLSYKDSQIIASTGAKQCLANALFAVLNPGDEVIVAVPYWVSYPELIRLADGIPVFVNTKEQDGFKYTVRELEKTVTSKTKLIVINSPNNPTGTVYTEKELKDIAEFAKEKDILILSDEIYEKLIYDGNKHVSIASISQDAYNRTIVVNGFSKTYAMTGWRLGYAASGNESIIKLMSNVQSHTTANPNSMAQYAGVAALKYDSPDVKNMIEQFDERRKYMLQKIDEISGLSAFRPEGAFYVVFSIAQILGKKCNETLIENSMSFSKLLLENEKVAVIPGAGFGFENYIRLSYATSMKNIIEGLDRIEKFIKNLK
ncbi:pyridoxal phosphate-dependent aminotransferase [Clostridium sp. LBM24168]